MGLNFKPYREAIRQGHQVLITTTYGVFEAKSIGTRYARTLNGSRFPLTEILAAVKCDHSVSLRYTYGERAELLCDSQLVPDPARWLADRLKTMGLDIRLTWDGIWLVLDPGHNKHAFSFPDGYLTPFHLDKRLAEIVDVYKVTHRLY